LVPPAECEKVHGSEQGRADPLLARAMSLEKGFFSKYRIARVDDAKENLHQCRAMWTDSLLHLRQRTYFIVRNAYIGVSGCDEVVPVGD
jgi:hypothetical protein